MFEKNMSDYDVSVLNYIYDRELKSLQRNPSDYQKTYGSSVLIFADPDLDGLSSAAQVYRKYADFNPSVIFARHSNVAEYFDKIEPDIVYFLDMFLGARHFSKMKSAPWYDSAKKYCLSDKVIPSADDSDVILLGSKGRSTSRKSHNHHMSALMDEYDDAYYRHFIDPYADSDVLDLSLLAETFRISENLAILGDCGDGFAPDDVDTCLLKGCRRMDSAIKYAYRHKDFDFLNILVRSLAFDEVRDPYLSDRIEILNSLYQDDVQSARTLLEENMISNSPNFALIKMPRENYDDYPFSVAASSLRVDYGDVFVLLPIINGTWQLIWRGGAGTGPFMNHLREIYDMRGGGHFDKDRSAGSMIVLDRYLIPLMNDLFSAFN